jgi:hypothetical protein
MGRRVDLGEALVKQAAQGTTSGKTRTGQPVFPKEKFGYDPVRDLYQCPAGQELPRKSESSYSGRLKLAHWNRSACPDCPLKQQCTTSKFRKLERGVNEPQVAARVKARPEIVAERKTIVEHVFGTLRNWGHDTFLTRGLPAVRAEFSLSALAYNLRRLLTLVGIEAFQASLKSATPAGAR